MENLPVGEVVIIVLGLVQALKIGGIESRYLPLCGLVVGVLASFFVPSVTLTQGIVGAIGAMGLYSGVKTTLTK